MIYYRDYQAFFLGEEGVAEVTRAKAACLALIWNFYRERTALIDVTTA